VGITPTPPTVEDELEELPVNPNDIDLEANLEQAVFSIRNKDKPKNTRKTQEPKIKEFYHFCELVYPHERHFKYNLTAEKVYKFMVFQAFREQKKRGGDANKSRLECGEYFDLVQYELIMEVYGSRSGGNASYPSPQNPIGAKAIESYRAVMKQIHVEQESRHVCGLTWEQIWKKPCLHLYRHVQERAPMIKKMTYQEKVDGEFAPYAIVERYEDIKQLLWEDCDNASGRRSLCTQLRHLCCVKYLTAGILRLESLHRAELSDFLGLNIPKTDSDIHQPWLMVHQIPIGKTSHGQKLYG
jgi:hypothetical protein